MHRIDPQRIQPVSVQPGWTIATNRWSGRQLQMCIWYLPMPRSLFSQCTKVRMVTKNRFVQQTIYAGDDFTH